MPLNPYIAISGNSYWQNTICAIFSFYQLLALKQIAMRSRPGEIQNQLIPVHLVYQQPIWRNMALTTPRIVTGKLMIPVLRWQRLPFSQLFYNIGQQRNIKTALFHALQILTEFCGWSYSIHRQAAHPSSDRHWNRSCRGSDRLSSSLLPELLRRFQRSAHHR